MDRSYLIAQFYASVRHDSAFSPSYAFGPVLGESFLILLYLCAWILLVVSIFIADNRVLASLYLNGLEGV